MSKSIFISYVYEDKKWRDQLKDWSEKKLLGAGVNITYERGDYRPGGEKAVIDEINLMIQGAAVVVFLIGQNSHNHSWIEYEANCAIGKNKKIVLIRIPNTSGKKPKLFDKHQEISFDINQIRVALE